MEVLGEADRNGLRLPKILEISEICKKGEKFEISNFGNSVFGRFGPFFFGEFACHGRGVHDVYNQLVQSLDHSSPRLRFVGTYPVITVRWVAIHALAVPTLVFLGSISAMQFM